MPVVYGREIRGFSRGRKHRIAGFSTAVLPFFNPPVIKPSQSRFVIIHLTLPPIDHIM